MMPWILLPFLIQIVAMLVDEFYFHYRRGLPRWERIGHPLDTLTLLLGFGWIYFVPIAPGSLRVYVALAVFSTFFVTKDEWVHTRFCAAGENWLHAVLFVTHPLVLLGAFLIWPSLHPPSTGLAPILPPSPFLAVFFKMQGALMIVYGIYQTVYWNLLWRESPKSTTPSTIR